MITNWAGNVTFRAERLHQPSSIDELRRLVASVPRVRVLGTGHSFNRIADTTGHLVSIAGLPQTIEIDPARATVTVAGGVRYGELAERLHSAGYAVPNLGSLPHISVAGACATGTHGSGDKNGNLSTSVCALEMVTADGSLVRLSRDNNEDHLEGTVIGLGALGIVTSLTLDVVPTFQARQYVYEGLPWDGLDEIFASAYSVSAFTDWKRPRISQVWRKCVGPVEAAWDGTAPVDGPRHPLPGMPTDNCTQQLGVLGPWHERLPHFRLSHTPSSGDELQSEFLVPRDAGAAALAAIDRIRDRVAAVLQICELRTVAADDLWLSPSYGRDSLAIHFTWVKDHDAVDPVIAAVQEALAPFDPRPHWGKLFVVNGRYPRMADFRELMHQYDPGGKFTNDFISAVTSTADKK